MTEHLSSKIKELRQAKGWTLKEMGQKSNLSAGYLSLVERDLTSINITSLQNIANALGVDINVFFAPPAPVNENVIRSHEQTTFFHEGSPHIYFSLAAGNLSPGQGKLEPIIMQMKPEKERQNQEPVSHEGEEFGYVLEGIMTLTLENREYELYPGDSYHILSGTPHSAKNYTNKLVRVLFVNTPKMFHLKQS